jgi:hypothetical protein
MAVTLGYNGGRSFLLQYVHGIYASAFSRFEFVTARVDGDGSERCGYYAGQHCVAAGDTESA